MSHKTGDIIEDTTFKYYFMIISADLDGSFINYVFLEKPPTNKIFRIPSKYLSMNVGFKKL